MSGTHEHSPDHRRGRLTHALMDKTPNDPDDGDAASGGTPDEPDTSDPQHGR
jgi:hypothetical protein